MPERNLHYLKKAISAETFTVQKSYKNKTATYRGFTFTYRPLKLIPLSPPYTDVRSLSGSLVCILIFIYCEHCTNRNRNTKQGKGCLVLLLTADAECHVALPWGCAIAIVGCPVGTQYYSIMRCLPTKQG